MLRARQNRCCQGGKGARGWAQAAGQAASAFADVATARAEVEAAQRIIATLEKQGDELRAELAQARRPFWRRWFDQK